MIAAGSFDVVGPYLAHARSVVSGGSICSNDYSLSKIDRLQTRLANERMFERLERSSCWSRNVFECIVYEGDSTSRVEECLDRYGVHADESRGPVGCGWSGCTTSR